MDMTNDPMVSADRIPSREECFELMARYGMLPNIIAHSRQVMRVALMITDHLKSGLSINRDLVMASALLHDITKTRSLQTKEPHAQSGGKLLRDLGYTSTGEIVEQHVLLSAFDPREKLSEREIVNYADKRVMHDRIVSLAQRVEDLLERYGAVGETGKMIRLNAINAGEIEKKIADSMSVDLESVVRGMQCEKRQDERTP